MIEMNKSKIVSIRLAEEQYELLEKQAQERKLKPGQAAREILSETLIGFDEKQESLLRRFDALDVQIGLLVRLCSIGAAAGAIPLEAEQYDPSDLQKKLTTHFFHARDLGKNLVGLVESNKL